MEMININVDNFEKEVLQSELPVLLDLWAPWCGPCKMIGPVVEKISEDTDDVKVAKLNVDEAPELAQKLKVAAIPTLLVFEGGQEKKRSVGLISKDEIMDLIQS